MLTEKDYCDYETCVALKELGYPTKMTFVSEQATIEIPINSGLIQLYEAQKFLRDEKNIDVLIELETKDIHLSSKYYSIHISYMSRFRREFSYISKNFDSYEEALLEGIKTAIKILKENVVLI